MKARAREDVRRKARSHEERQRQAISDMEKRIAYHSRQVSECQIAMEGAQSAFWTRIIEPEIKAQVLDFEEACWDPNRIPDGNTFIVRRAVSIFAREFLEKMKDKASEARLAHHATEARRLVDDLEKAGVKPTPQEEGAT